MDHYQPVENDEQEPREMENREKFSKKEKMYHIAYILILVFWIALFGALLPFTIKVSEHTVNKFATTDNEPIELRKQFENFPYFYNKDVIYVSVSRQNINGTIEESYLDEVTYRVNKSVEQSGWGDAVLAVTGYALYREDAEDFGLIFTSSDKFMTLITVFVNNTYLPDITMKFTNYLRNEVETYDTRNGKYALYVTSSVGLLNGMYTESSRVKQQQQMLIILFYYCLIHYIYSYSNHIHIYTIFIHYSISIPNSPAFSIHIQILI